MHLAGKSEALVFAPSIFVQQCHTYCKCSVTGIVFRCFGPTKQRTVCESVPQNVLQMFMNSFERFALVGVGHGKAYWRLCRLRDPGSAETVEAR